MPEPFVAPVPSQDTIPPKERFGNFVEDPVDNPFDLKDPASIVRDVEYDPQTGLYIITERIGEDYFRAPTYMTFEEYQEWSAKRDREQYWRQLNGVYDSQGGPTGKVDPITIADISDDIIDRLFGGSEVDIRPQGNIDMTFGVDFQRQDNPILLERQRRTGGFDFDMDIQVNVDGKIGEKLNTSFNYNTRSTFDFENKLKLDYNSQEFGEDDIIQKIEAGDVSLPLRGTLIQGAQSLFGIKTEMKFGHLRLTAIASQQRSEKNDLVIQGGSVLQEFEVEADRYVENRNFFLSHFNRETFEGALQNLPQINSLFRITRLEVWITNDKNQTTDVRDIVAVADLGEARRMTPGNEGFVSPMDTMELKDICDLAVLPTNSVNTILSQLQANPSNRFVENAIDVLTNQLGLQPTRDFEKIRARRLSPSEYSYHPELGFITLNINPQSDQVIGVAYEYTYNGVQYQVGELSDIVPVDPDNQSVMYVKMLKSTVQRIDLPIWDLMMKNFYRIGGGDVNPEEFELDVFYEDPGAGFKRFLPLPQGSGLGNTPLITILNLDNLNVTGDPQPDGRFDFQQGLTVFPRQGTMMFPVLEPFGSSLRKAMVDAGVPDPVIEQYIYDELYDSTLVRAREFPEFNRFTLKGKSKSSTSSDISLGTFNIPENSVRVTAGGQTLQEGVDYIIDYNIGRLQILNDAYIQPGTPIRVSFEDNALFSFQKKTMLGLRADYDVNDNLAIGGTFMQLFERPFTQKVNIGEDPINNKVYGLDLSYSNEAPWLTRIVDGIPGINTKEPSQINFQAEFAAIKPGHSKAINRRKDEKEGTVYIDDFEGTASNLDLRTPENRWQLASVPQDAKILEPTELFPESEFTDTLLTGVNRAHLNWYRIDRSIRNGEDRSNPYTRAVDQQEIFRGRTRRFGANDFRTFDMTYQPNKRGQYNFDIPGGYPGYSAGLNEQCELNDPESRWGGIQRDIQTTDFEQANYEAIEFWMLDPYELYRDADGSNDTIGGEGFLVINLGNVSEDVLKDGRLFYEHGLPRDTSEAETDTTNWGRIPKIQPVVNAFSIDEQSRIRQDVGYDGFDDAGERLFYEDYLNRIRNSGFPLDCINQIERDPANDNFIYFRNDTVYDANSNVFERYSRYNGAERNSPPNPPQNQRTIAANTNRPNNEDLNDDLSLSEGESYYQYVIRMDRGPDGNPVFTSIGKDGEMFNFQQDTITGSTGTWYRFKIPLDAGQPVNGIQGFRSIRFMRMYMTGFEKRTTLRFATLDLVRSQWRRYTRSTCSGPDSDTDFEVDAVSVEEHSSKVPFPYEIPEGIQRERIIGSTFQDIFQNEQSLALQFCELADECDVRVYKNLNLDMRVFERMQMFVHAEEADSLNSRIPDGDLSVFIRLGSDFENNYYEYELPLAISRNPFASDLKEEIWMPDSNNVDFAFRELTDLKIRRNNENFPISEEFEEDVPGRRYTLRIRGNPTLGYVKNVMIGVRNREGGQGLACGEVWVNELRVSGLDERGGIATTARLDLDLADFGNLGFSTTYSSIGYGAIDQKLDERAKESVFQFDASAGLELGKFFGDDAGIRIPFYAQYSTTTRTPQYDPIDLDLDLKEKLSRAPDKETRDSIREQAIDYTALKVLSVTNVRKERRSQNTPMPWDISNFSVSYSYSKSEAHNEIVEKDDLTQHKAQLDYVYALPDLTLQPFKNLSQSSWLKPLTELNLNPLPSSFSFNTILDRRFGQRDYRFSDPIFKTWFDKRFTWDRNYNLQWDLTRSISVDFNATNEAVIDEPDEYLDRANLIRIPRKERQDSIWSNLRDFGRTKDYSHSIRASYKVPTNLFPFLDWVRADVSVDADYAWSAASINTDSLGNVIQNGQNRKFTADLDFTRLYNKSNFLRKINGQARGRSNRPPARTRPDRDRDQPDQGDDRRERRQRDPNAEPSTIAKVLIRPLMTIRKFRFSYSRDFSTVVPGYTPPSRLLGMDGFNAPGWDFILGFQPDIRRSVDGAPDWIDENGIRLVEAGGEVNNLGWIVENPFQNQPILQSESKTIEGRLTLEPFADFKIEVDAKRTIRQDFSVFYKNTEKINPNVPFEDRYSIERLSPREMGSFSMSYFSLPTLFMGSEAEINNLFKEFERMRATISQQRGESGTTHPIDGEAYTEGFGGKQRDVIIPAFIAAYTDKDPENFELTDMFDWLPRPNWTLTYNGLQKLPMFKDIFSSVRITHGYKSTLNVNSFESDLNYTPDPSLPNPQINPPDNLNEATLNYFSRYIVPQVGIDEQFAPLIGIEVKTKNDLNFHFDYAKRRGLQLGFISNELAENRVTTVEVGFDWVLKDINLPFLPGYKARRDNNRRGDQQDPNDPTGTQQGGRGRGPINGNDLEILFDFSFSDNITVNHYLDQESLPQPTRGSKEISISPAMRYNLNKNVNLRMFFDYRKTTPYTTTGYPITSTSAGVTVQVVLE